MAGMQGCFPEIHLVGGWWLVVDGWASGRRGSTTNH
jgi:hypothetical protein